MHRSILIIIAVTVCSVTGCTSFRPTPPNPYAYLKPLVKQDKKWEGCEFREFVIGLTDEHCVTLMRSFNLVNDKKVQGMTIPCIIDMHGGRQKCHEEISKQLIWKSSNITTYPFKDKNNPNYHYILKWTAEKIKVDKSYLNGTTFDTERVVLLKVFANMWDKMTKEEREKALKNTSSLTVEQKTAIVAGTGTAAAATIATLATVGGFAFYTTMSSIICSAGTAIGCTISFVGYEGAATMAGALSGPVGWACIAGGGVLTVALAGSADAQDTALLIIAIHLLKAEAIKEKLHGASLRDVKIPI